MSIKAGVGISEGDDDYSVGANACQEAVTQLGKTSPDMLFVFSSVKYDQKKILEGVRSVNKEALIAGCSTSGEITTQGPANNKSAAVMAIASKQIKFFGGVGENIKKNARKAGQAAAKNVTKKIKKEKLKGFIMFPDVLVGNGAEIVRGVLDELGEHFPAVGGAPGDDFLFQKTYQYLNDKVYSGAVVGVGLSGEFSQGFGVKHGWAPIGLPKKVTKSKGSILYELDGKPAIQIYEEYFGKEKAGAIRKEPLARLAITYPLGMSVPGSDELLIRDPITVDKNGAITCAAEIPQGSEIRLMIGSKDQAIKVAKDAAQNAKDQLNGKEPRAIIIFNCIARDKLFGDRAGEEITAIQEVLGKEVPLIGFYTYGEQAPLGGQVREIKKCNTSFHNETVVIYVLGE